ACAGDSNPCPAGIVRLAMVGYDVQPEAAAPPVGRKKLSKMMMKAGHMNQYDIMFSFGNAMSFAPIMRGIVKLPKPPASTGMITKKIMIVACMLKNMLYESGDMCCPALPGHSSLPMIGISACGQPSWRRTNNARVPPIRKK